MRFLPLLLPLLLCGCQNIQDMPVPENFSWQGHRGARGLLPENTVPAFLTALDSGMNTLELDIAVSADSQIVVSHEPWMSAEICLDKTGAEFSKAEGEKLLLYRMPYSEIALYDCGRKKHPRFPEQKRIKVHKPLLTEVIRAADAHAREKGYPLPSYNIEIKSDPAYDGRLTPPVAEFVALTLRTLNESGIAGRTNLQSFDLRTLEEIRRQNAKMPVAYLTETETDTEAALAKLSYRPDIYSPYYLLVNQKMIEVAHARNIKVIPWTVNETADMQRLINMGADGIITDYPNRIPKSEAKK